MKYTYINSRLHPIEVAAAGKVPREWVFSRAEPWLLLTPTRLERLAFRLGLLDDRVSALIASVRRHHPHPETFRRTPGLDKCVHVLPAAYPLAICPRCDRLHHPHPAEALWSCARCREEIEQASLGRPLLEEDRRLDREARRRIQENDPGAFDEGVLSPHWRLNKKRRLIRDWEGAINRILLGMSYRRVAKDFSCSVGTLHRKVHDRKYWENN